jgi:hypothetical protein
MLRVMPEKMQHPSYTVRDATVAEPVRGGPQHFAGLRIDWRVAQRADHACCCSAKPAVVAVMPPTPQRPHATDLLLCGHHYRICRQRLAESGATVLGLGGAPIGDDARSAELVRA